MALVEKAAGGDSREACVDGLAVMMHNGNEGARSLRFITPLLLLCQQLRPRCRFQQMSRIFS